MEDGVVAMVNGHEEKLGPVETIVLAIGVASVNELVSKLEGKLDKVITIGDALKARKAIEAIEEGFIAGIEI